MALPLSGNPISLNQMHIEVGGTTGTLCSINDADIRALIGKASGVTMSFSEWFGASAGWSPSLTIGTFPAGYYTGYGYHDGTTGIGTAVGSVTDNTVDELGGATLKRLYWVNTVNSLQFAVAGNLANSGFTNLVVNGNSFARTAATFSYFGSYNYTNWSWTTSSTNPIGTSGTISVDLT